MYYLKLNVFLISNSTYGVTNNMHMHPGNILPLIK